MASEKRKSDEPAPLQDSIHLHNPLPSRSPRPTTRRRYLIFVVTGNPGLIEYYRPFMTHLFAQLTASASSVGNNGSNEEEVEFQVCGHSLQGFEIAEEAPANRRGRGRRRWLRPFGLREQVRFVEARLGEAVARMQQQYAQEAEDEKAAAVGGVDGLAPLSPPKVVLVGHSVGAYILLELVRRHRERLEQRMKGEMVEVGEEMLVEPDIVGGICLFPTVMEINRSVKGVRMIRLTKIPFLPVVLGSLVRMLTWIIPMKLLKMIAEKAGKMNERNAKITATSFRANGFHQTLHLGFDELRQITADRWDEEVWGAVHPSHTTVPRPKLFFYFAEQDPWVANRTRDDLMRMRGRGMEGEDWKPLMEIDQMEIPHAFCLDYSAPIAEKVAEYIETITKLDGASTLADSRQSSIVKDSIDSATTRSSRKSSIR